MIELTVKTLDSQNHQFTVEDDITVEQFKVRIAETVNIPAETQRIIYCGRVLQDTSKLADYDVHGKVVHLVQRAPPGSTPRPSSRSASPQPPRRTFRGFRAVDPGNSMYVASMAIPGNLMESQGIVPPPPTHNLSSSRLSVARRMMRRAEAVIGLLENPNARAQEQNTGEEQEEEVTTVFEARVVVPTVVNQRTNNVIHVVRRNENDEPIEIGIEYPAASGNSTPAGAIPRAASAENLSAEPRPENSANTLPENASPTSEMAELLTTLGQLQVRFAPFLDRYHRFMQEDPEVPAEIHRETQTMLNRVSEVLHFLGHAYHSLSDIIVRVRAPPPRPLLCRPILIQHSAVLQTGIPIQVEVSSQINMPADRQTTANSSQASSTASAATSGSTTTSSAASTSEATPTSATTAAASTTNSAPTTQTGAQSVSVPPTFVGLPFLPAAMRVQSFPVEIRAVRSSSAPPRSQNNNNNTVTTAASPAPATNASNPIPTTASSGPASNQEGGQNAAFNFNNPNVEFFMEVTPEGITIDSLETTLVDSNRANDLLRGALDGPSPDFLQSLMQVAGQIMSRNLTAASSAPSSGNNSTTTAESASTTGAQAAASSAGQNSQARGNTQTNPTTATYTRSTPRPHVHLAQQAMQGGFDPFLPCNSHHISRRNRLQASQMDTSENSPRGPQTFTLRTNASRSENRSSTQSASSNSRTAPSAQSSTTQSNNHQDIENFIHNIFESVRRTDARPSDPDRNRRFGDGLQDFANQPMLGAFLSGIFGRESRENLTLEQLLLERQEDLPYVAGESILGDLQMLLFRNLSLIDMVTLYADSLAPINRFLPDVRNFIQTRICNGDTTQSGIDRGVENILTELRPTLQTFSSAPCHDDTDLVRSIEELLRHRLPNIINIGLNLNNYSVSQLIGQFVTTVKQILALFLYVVRSQGHSGFDQVLEYLLNRIPLQIPNYSIVLPISLLRIQFREYLRNLNVPNSVLQPYIVRSSEANRTSAAQNDRTDRTSDMEPGDSTQTDNVDTMEIDDQVTAGTSNLASQSLNNTEPLSSILIGSERWRSQVPEGWLPMIARDAQRQRRQNAPTTFSDTYLASMPSKRRKLVNNSKPHDSLPQVISDTVREAITATGLDGIAPLDTVAAEAGSSTEIQAAYRSLLRTTVQASLEDNEDFVPERFPNVANYFNKDLQ